MLKRNFLLGPILVAACLGSGAALLAESSAMAQSAAPPGWLGIGMAPLPGGGIEVKRVVNHSPADLAGLKSGDHVVRINGIKTEMPQDLTRVVRAHGIEKPATVDVMRDGKLLSVSVSLTRPPSPDSLFRMDHVGAPLRPWTGLAPVYGAFPGKTSDLAGRVTVVEFWATWCGPCRIVRPILDSWHKRYAAQGLTVLGISAEETETVAAHGIRTQGRYALAADPEGHTTKDYGVAALPTMLVVDRRGIVRDVVVGITEERLNQVERLVQQLLAEPSAPK